MILGEPGQKIKEKTARELAGDAEQLYWSQGRVPGPAPFMRRRQLIIELLFDNMIFLQ